MLFSFLIKNENKMVNIPNKINVKEVQTTTLAAPN